VYFLFYQIRLAEGTNLLFVVLFDNALIAIVADIVRVGADEDWNNQIRVIIIKTNGAIAICF
jgi:hypothetical protein